METTTATTADCYWLDGDTYVNNGAFHGEPAEWAATFNALGGESAGITAAWQHGLPIGSGMFLTVTGSPAARAFAEETVR